MTRIVQKDDGKTVATAISFFIELPHDVPCDAPDGQNGTENGSRFPSGPCKGRQAEAGTEGSTATAPMEILKRQLPKETTTNEEYVLWRNIPV